MPVTTVSLIRGDKIGIETDYRDALPVNMYAVEKPILGARGYMIAYPGLTSFGNGVGVDRGGVYNERQGNHFRVSGNKLISVSENGAVTELGTIPGASQGAMPYSFNTQCIISDGNMYLYDTVGGFRQVTDKDLGNPIDGVWVDGYYFLTDGEYIYHTDITDESAIDPLKFATAEFMPDPSLGVAKTQDNKVVVFGRYTIEYFVNAATANFAFQRVETRAQKIGIVATHAKTEVGGSFFIVGGRKNESIGVHEISVGRSIKVSTREIDKILAIYSEPELSDIRVESRFEDNVILIIVHLPNETLCYNAALKSWSILKTGLTGAALYRAINGIFDARNGQWTYGDKRDGNIGILDETVFTQYDADEPQEFELFTPLLKLDRQSIDEIEIETIPGHTITDDAIVFFSMTYDGLTYGKEYTVDYGGPNEYNQRFIIRRLGYVSDWAGLKFRGATRSKTAFGLMTVQHA